MIKLKSLLKNYKNIFSNTLVCYNGFGEFFMKEILIATGNAHKVEEFKENCKSSAKEEGTDYDTYLETSLKQNGVETTEELVERFNELNETMEEGFEDYGPYISLWQEYVRLCFRVKAKLQCQRCF